MVKMERQTALFAFVISLICIDLWLVVLATNTIKADKDKIEHISKQTDSNSELLKLREPIIYSTSERTKQNQEMILENQRRIDDVREILRKLESKSKVVLTPKEP